MYGNKYTESITAYLTDNTVMTVLTCTFNKCLLYTNNFVSCYMINYSITNRQDSINKHVHLTNVYCIRIILLAVT